MPGNPADVQGAQAGEGLRREKGSSPSADERPSRPRIERSSKTARLAAEGSKGKKANSAKRGQARPWQELGEVVRGQGVKSTSQRHRCSRTLANARRLVWAKTPVKASKAQCRRYQRLLSLCGPVSIPFRIRGSLGRRHLGGPRLIGCGGRTGERAGQPVERGGVSGEKSQRAGSPDAKKASSRELPCRPQMQEDDSVPR